MRAIRSIALAALVASCSSGAPTREVNDSADLRARSVVDALSRGPLAVHATGAIVRDPRGIRAASAGGAWSPAARLIATAPPDDTASLHLEVDGVDGASLDVRALDVAETTTRVVGRALVQLDAVTDTDVVRVLGDSSAEELRVLRSRHARATAQYSLKLGAALSSVRIVDARVEVLDAAGRVRIATAPVVAFDAAGVARTPRLRLDREVLTIELDTSGLAYPITLDPAWSAAASMASSRGHGSATTLNDGRVLVTGGYGGVPLTALTTAELFSPTTGTWSSARAASYSHSAALLLPSGNVLAFGGSSACEVYNPTTDTWTIGGAFNTSRWYFGATILPSGKVLAVGGRNSVDFSTAELWDPTTRNWTLVTAAMSQPRTSPGVATLSTGKVLVVGGTNSSNLSTSEFFDPGTSTFLAAPSMTYARNSSLTVLLADGRVLVPGFASAIFNPSTNTWSSGGSMVGGGQRAVLLSTGQVLIAGGEDLPTAQVFDPARGIFQSAGNLSLARDGLGLAALPGWRALSAGGDAGFVYLSTAEIYTPQPNGTACTSGGECLSAFCVDGYCCNSGCTGQCQACDVAGSLGTCTAVASGAPHGARTSCAPYFCAAGSCATTCASDAGCVSTHYCAGGACVSKKVTGASCSTATECASAFCVDGYCCGTACDGQCEACNATPGTCTAVAGAPRGSRPACTGTGAGTACGPRCDGSNRTACTYAPTSTSCGAAGCTAGTETHLSTCDGSGLCGDIPKSCGAYACGATACKTSCATSGDCATGNYCKANVCVPSDDNGTLCTDAGSCKSGFCVDGVCCATNSCASGSTCASATRAGTCAKTAGQTCTDASDCGSGHCVDGVCCDRACNGQCEACDVAGKVGTCSPVSGAPHGARTKCDDGAGDPCKARACSGASGETSSCNAYVAGPGTVCASAKCEGTSYVAAGTCDGAGSCDVPKASSCDTYKCDATGCKTSCTDAKTDCADGYECVGGKCIVRARCAADVLSSIAPNGTVEDCAPYRCGEGGTCLKGCDSSAECAAGRVCDVVTRECTTPPAATPSDSSVEEEGGCSIATPGRPRSTVAWFGVAALGAIVVRRRRKASLAAATALASVMACSTTAPERGQPPGTTLARLRSFSPYASIGRGAGLRVVDGGWSAPSTIDAVVPRSSRGHLHLRAGAAAMDVTALDLHDVRGAAVESAVVYENAALDLDVIRAIDNHGVEELRILRSSRAPRTARYHVSHGSELSLRVRGDRVEVVDASGAVRMATDPIVAYDANGRRFDGRVTLEGDELVVNVDALDDATFPVAVDPAWTTQAGLLTARNWHSAVRVSDGSVLVAGGGDGPSTTYSTAERFDPTAGTWAYVGSMSTRRQTHTASVLASGKVLIAGGFDDVYSTGPQSLSTSELYDPTAKTFGSVATMNARRAKHATVTLPSGKVLAIGGALLAGATVTQLSTAETYDPGSNTWTAVAAMSTARDGHTATLLSSGKVLVVGGGVEAGPVTRTALSTAEIFDPTAGTWSSAAAMTTAREGHMAVALPSGKVIAFGGQSGATRLSSVEIYDPASNSWSSGTSMLRSRFQGTATMLTNGWVLLAGGNESTTEAGPDAEVYDPIAGVTKHRAAGDYRLYRRRHGATVLADNSVLITGGYASDTPSSWLTFSFVDRFSLATNATACTAGGECASGACADGVCCSTACTGGCEACNLTGKVGTCSAVTSGAPVGSRSCFPYAQVCTSSGCKTSCTSFLDCATPAFCDAGTCTPRKANGQSCVAHNNCVSGRCVDGVCCDSYCEGQCQACDVAGKVGTCSPVEGAPHGMRGACGGAGAGTACGSRCNGVNVTACTLPAAETACSENACADGNETHASTCNGAGACSDVVKTCAPYVCGSSTCKTACLGHADCVAGYFCQANVCVAAKDLGEACVDDRGCSTGHCTDSVCCGVAACAAGESCATATKKGTCAKVNGSTCVAAGECGSGVCRDGVCCDRACDGMCEACDVKGHIGACFPVAGAPHGDRPACPAASDGAVCSARACSGKPEQTTTCDAFAPATTECGAARCEGSVLFDVRRCDGAGACVASTGVECAPYACAPEGCRTACSADVECATGNRCSNGKCISADALCSPDRSASIKKDGSRTECAPFLCGSDGNCATECATSADCTSGSVCETASKRCVGAGDSADEGGCSIGVRAADSAPWLALLGVTIATLRRRRISSAT